MRNEWNALIMLKTPEFFEASAETATGIFYWNIRG